MTFTGGGFRALSSNVGLLVGLLAAKARAAGAQGASTSFAATGLLSRFDGFSTVSGSTWFLAELAYAPGFGELLERMAAAPKTAGAAFNKAWMTRWLAHAGGRRSTTALEQVLQDSGLGYIAQDLAELSYFLRRGLTWDNFVSVLLEDTAGISRHVTLGSPSAAWLQNKTWLACNSVVAGSQDKQVTVTMGFGTSVRYRLHGQGFAEIPLYLPAKFSTTFGAGPLSSAPLPFVAPGVAAATTVEYEGSTFFGLNKERATSPQLGDFKAAEQGAGLLPVHSVVASSSAFLGAICLNRGYSVFADWLDSDFTPWVAFTGQADPGDGFKEADILVEQISREVFIKRRLDAMASASVLGVVDAAFTDSSGIAHAVGAGATEITAVAQVGPRGLPHWSGVNLFQGGRTEGKQGGDAGLPWVAFPIFAESVQHLEQAYAGFTQWVRPTSNDSTYLTTFATGTLNLTTVHNQWYGIKAGRNVTMHVVVIATTLHIGALNDFNSYNHLVQELVDTALAPENEEAMGVLLTQV